MRLRRKPENHRKRRKILVEKRGKFNTIII